MDNYGYYVISCMTIAGTQWSCRRGPITEVIHNNKIIIQLQFFSGSGFDVNKRVFPSEEILLI